MKPGWGGFAKGRKRDHGMNGLETLFDAELTRMLGAGEILWRSAFEPIKFRLADNTFYHPDFLGLPPDEILTVYDVKGGLVPEKNKLKLKMIAELFPLRVVMVRKTARHDGEELPLYRARLQRQPFEYEPI